MVTAQIYEDPLVGEEDARMPIADQIEDLIRRAEPRLLRLARSQQIAPDAAEDIVQETLLEAWRSLENLRDEARFDAWLDGICRNVCLRHQRKQGIAWARETVLDTTDDAIDPFTNLVDPAVFDPAEELTRRDIAFLLDRALGYLAPENRALVEQHYLAELPQRELAARLGMTLGALEARLHRARGQLLRVLSHDLRAESLALGLALTPEDAAGWRETRIWCVFCGQQRMRGIFEPMPDGRINMQLRCLNCAPMVINSLGLADLSHARSFLPATKKIIDEVGQFFAAALVAGGKCHCWVCHQPGRLRIVHDPDFASPFCMPTWLVFDCGCESTFSTAISIYLYLPPVRDFLFGSERVVVGPEVEMTYAGQNAIRFSLLNLVNGRCAYIFANAATLLPLGVVVE
jgi:RNA polymerase sigma factor (sigma-70 family)